MYFVFTHHIQFRGQGIIDLDRKTLPVVGLIGLQGGRYQAGWIRRVRLPHQLVEEMIPGFVDRRLVRNGIDNRVRRDYDLFRSARPADFAHS